MTWYGRPQNTTGLANNAHEVASEALARQLSANAPAGSYIVFNRSLRTALGRHNVPDVVPGQNGRPDVTLVVPRGRQTFRVTQHEIRSQGQNNAELQARMQQNAAGVNTGHGLTIGRSQVHEIEDFDL